MVLGSSLQNTTSYVRVPRRGERPKLRVSLPEPLALVGVCARIHGCVRAARKILATPLQGRWDLDPVFANLAQAYLVTQPES